MLQYDRVYYLKNTFFITKKKILSDKKKQYNTFQKIVACVLYIGIHMCY